MSFEQKEITIKIDSVIYSALEEYSSYAGVTEEQVMNYIVRTSLSEFQTTYEKLKQGYIEMGNINLEISEAFNALDNEAYSLIKD